MSPEGGRAHLRDRVMSPEAPPISMAPWAVAPSIGRSEPSPVLRCTRRRHLMAPNPAPQARRPIRLSARRPPVKGVLIGSERGAFKRGTGEERGELVRWAGYVQRRTAVHVAQKAGLRFGSEYERRRTRA